jgi:hypothetical protein
MRSDLSWTTSVISEVLFRLLMPSERYITEVCDTVTQSYLPPHQLQFWQFLHVRKAIYFARHKTSFWYTIFFINVCLCLTLCPYLLDNVSLRVPTRDFTVFFLCSASASRKIMSCRFCLPNFYVFIRNRIWRSCFSFCAFFFYSPTLRGVRFLFRKITFYYMF